MARHGLPGRQLARDRDQAPPALLVVDRELRLVRSGRDPEEIIREKGLAQVSDVASIEAVVDDILAKNASEVEKYRSGKKNIFGFFVGQVMKAMKGKGNPQVVNQLLKQKLGD